MSFDEILVLLVSCIYSFWMWSKWYSSIFQVWPLERGKEHRMILALLPILCLTGIYIILRTLASFDVVTDSIYLFFYIVLGSAWLAVGNKLVFMFLDLSWRDDAIEGNNPAAVLAVSGGLIGMTAIYAGANIGDGPGWWCVIFAGGLALISWYVILRAMDALTEVFNKITVGRNIAVGTRMGLFMAASGIILGRGAAGDWTSFSYTVIEFIDAWPVLILALIAGAVEWLYGKEQTSYSLDNNFFGALLWGLFYCILAILAVTLLPSLPQNPLY